MKLTNEMRRQLVTCANQIRQRAYAPYSGYTVGAALLTAAGKIYTGVNVENASYPVGICAERVAVVKAVSEGERDFSAIAVVTPDGGTPCGMCRQMLAEFGLEITVLIADGEEQIVQETTVGGLLPGAFGPQNLKTPRP